MSSEANFSKLMKQRAKLASSGKSELERLCEKHRIPIGAVTPPERIPRVEPLLPEGWKENLSQAARAHLREIPKQLRVHLMRGVEAVVYWPAAYIERDYLYYIGETIPTQARTASRPGNFIIELVGGSPKEIVLRKSIGGELNRYHFAYIPKGFRQVRTLGHHDWKVSTRFTVLEDNYTGLQ